MTAALTFTRAGIRRAIEGVRSAGLPITAVTIAPDGAVTIHTTEVKPMLQEDESGSDDDFAHPEA